MEHLFCKLGHSPRAYKLVHEAGLAYLIPCVWVPLSAACFGTLHKMCVMLWGGGEGTTICLHVLDNKPKITQCTNVHKLCMLYHVHNLCT